MPQLKARTLEHVLVPGSTYPKSQYAGWRHTLPTSSESHAIQELRKVWDSQRHSQDEYNIWILSDFSIYHPYSGSKFAGEFVSLQYLQNPTERLLFDGVLSLGRQKHYVQGVPFEILTVEGYGLDTQMTDMRFCLQSCLGKRADVWYELDVPSVEYRPYFEAFDWIAVFGKHFVDYLDATEKVTLRDFRSFFAEFMSTSYPRSTEFMDWRCLHPSCDYRQAVNAHVTYLRKECYGLPSEDLLVHPLWDEIDPTCPSSIPKEQSAYHKTVVTPFVRCCFQNMAFASELETLHPDPQLATARKLQRRTLGLTDEVCLRTPAPRIRLMPVGTIEKGDVVCVSADKQSKWKHAITRKWYAYVQDVRTRKDGAQKLDVLWLYEPSDTTMGHGYYPFENELFFSDNCSCGNEALDVDDVLGLVDVAWNSRNPAKCNATFFIRQKFRTKPSEDYYDFTSLQESDLTCECKQGVSDFEYALKHYAVHDTVLVRQSFKDQRHQSEISHDPEGPDTSVPVEEVLEPAIIVKISRESSRITLRRLSRLSRRDSRARPNHLFFTDVIAHVAPAIVVRKFSLARFADAVEVTAPYDRHGAGDFYFYTTDMPGVDCSPQPLHQTSHELPAYERLKGLGLFCGGGSFDRGLEEGGAVDMRYAVDWAEHALHTYFANAADPKKLQVFLGSVNDHLAKALSASTDVRVPRIGDIDFISAGSPCPGFSRMQLYKDSKDSLRNCSLVASVMAYVDLYTPKYMLLENVTEMAYTPPERKHQNVFSQILCCLVAMGYQVQQFLGDPQSVSSCQSRSRIFIVATAPTCQPLVRPSHTHGYAWLNFRSKVIGRSSNGLPFGQRENDVTPFPFRSAEQVFGDLPNIGNGHLNTCIPFPDHRTSRREIAHNRNLMSMIPRWPYGMGFVQAHDAGTMAKPQLDKYTWRNEHRASAKGKAWCRMYPQYQVDTITTALQPSDAFKGRVLHWDQPRCMTVMEARRVQSIPDHEVIIGNPFQQWKIIGNGVDRMVAFALGLQLSEAWKETLKQQGSKSRPASKPVDVNVSRSSRIVIDLTEDSTEEYSRRSVTITRTSTTKLISTKRKSLHISEITQAEGSRSAAQEKEYVIDDDARIKKRRVDTPVGGSYKHVHTDYVQVKAKPARVSARLSDNEKAIVNPTNWAGRPQRPVFPIRSRSRSLIE